MPASFPTQSPGAGSVLPSLGLSLHSPSSSPGAARRARGCGRDLRKGPDLPSRDRRPRRVQAAPVSCQRDGVRRSDP